MRLQTLLVVLIPGTSKETAEAVNAFQKWLEKESDYLLILDNADEPEQLESLIPPNRKGHLLFTSRKSFARRMGVREPLKLDVMDEGEAIEFFWNSGVCEPDDDMERNAAAELAFLLGYLPLALEQAAAYIQHNVININQYRVEWLDEHGPEAGGYEKTVHNTWNKSFEAVKRISEASADLLIHAAFLAPDPIPYCIFVNRASAFEQPLSDALANVQNDKNQLYSLLKPLADYSLVQRDNKAELIIVHRLVQQVIREAKFHLSVPFLKRIIVAIAYAHPGTDFTNWRVLDQLLPHQRLLVRSAHDSSIETAAVASLLMQVGFYLSDVANIVKPCHFLREPYLSTKSPSA